MGERNVRLRLIAARPLCYKKTLLNSDNPDRPADGSSPLTAAATRIEIFKVLVQFGDCDPAGIAFYPNFFRWFDAASRHYFDRCGLPSWHVLQKAYGIIGTPLLEISSRFIKPVTYGDNIEIHTSIVQWNAKVFIHRHELFRDGELLAFSNEKRVFACRDQDTGRIQAVLIPDHIKVLCQAPA